MNKIIISSGKFVSYRKELARRIEDYIVSSETTQAKNIINTSSSHLFLDKTLGNKILN